MSVGSVGTPAMIVFESLRSEGASKPLAMDGCGRGRGCAVSKVALSSSREVRSRREPQLPQLIVC